MMPSNEKQMQWLGEYTVQSKHNPPTPELAEGISVCVVTKGASGGGEATASASCLRAWDASEDVS